ncbi:MAG TPA: GNAT family N-acetyltransferase [Verrucomicrobiae bacterium]|jgi:CelD/BcsL family acetyltransferase involved in cellulose biosynthesis
MLLELAAELGTRELRRLSELEEIAPAWELLWRSCPLATPFQSPAWLLPWWRHFGSGALRVLALTSEEQLVGLAPFYLYQQSPAAPRQLLLLGSGNSDYLDILVLPGYEKACLELVSRWIEKLDGEFDACEMLSLSGEAVAMRIPTPLGLAETFNEIEPCPILHLPTTQGPAEAFFKNECFASLEYYRRRAARMGEIKFGAAADEEQMEAYLIRLAEFEQHRWDARGVQSVMAPERVRAFHLDVTRQLLHCGMLRLYAMQLDSRIMAVLYGFSDARKFYYYLGSFDPEFHRLSPGKLVLAHAIHAAVSERLSSFDFLRGAEAYKYEWGARDTPGFRRVLRPGKEIQL